MNEFCELRLPSADIWRGNGSRSKARHILKTESKPLLGWKMKTEGGKGEEKT